MDKSKTGIKKTLSRPSFLIINVLLLVLVGWGFAGEFIRNRSMKEEIRRLEKQAEELESRNLKLNRLAEKYSGSSMLEREARLKLNLKKPGEEVVVVRDVGANETAEHGSSERDSSNPTVGAAEEDRTEKQSNFNKWIKHFFPQYNID